MGDEEVLVEQMVKRAWACSLENGYDSLHEEPHIEACNLADQDVDVGHWVWAAGETGYDRRLALLLKVVTRLLAEAA